MDQKYGSSTRHTILGLAMSFCVSVPGHADIGAVIYGYDDAGRLVSSTLTRGDNATYTLDAAGNRKSATRSPQAQLETDRRLTAFAASDRRSSDSVEDTPAE